MVKPVAILRSEIVDAYNACKSEGIAPTPESVAVRVSAPAVPLVATTLRIVRLFERSGLRSARQLRKWAETQKDEDAAKGFGTGVAHDIAKAMYKQDTVDDDDVREPEVIDDEKSHSGDDEGGGGKAGGVTAVDTGALDVFRQWQEQIEEARRTEAAAVRAQEQTLARAILEGEKEKAVLRERAAAANARLYAFIAVVVALAAGVAIGAAYVSRVPSVGSAVQEGAYQAPTPPVTPHPSAAQQPAPTATPAQPEAAAPPVPVNEQPKGGDVPTHAP